MLEYYHNNLIDIFNSAYNSYLIKIHPAIFLNTLVYKVIKLINANCGVIMKCNSNKIDIISHATNDSLHNKKESMFLKDDWLLFSNYIKENKILDDNSLIMQCIS